MTTLETTTTMVELPQQDAPFDEAQLAAAAFLPAIAVGKPSSVFLTAAIRIVSFALLTSTRVAL